MPKFTTLERGLLAALVLALIIVVAQASWIEAKAKLSQILIADAWVDSLKTRHPQRPWPWADTWPVLRLTPPNGKPLYVLESGSGEALAFGPGRLAAGLSENSLMIAGHQDTHFRFLEDIRLGDRISLQDSDGITRTYQVQNLRVADTRHEALQPPAGTTSSLLLITCYPFNSTNAGGPLRYLVSASLSGDAGYTF